MEIKKKALGALALAFSLSFAGAEPDWNYSTLKGFESYRNSEWTNAAFYLRKAVSLPENSVDSVWYMLIMSQMYSESFSSAINDCDYFLKTFEDSMLRPAVEYQRGRAYACSHKNDAAVLALSTFCNEYPESPMFSSALYWIAECFYNDCDYETSRGLYERIVSEYPDSVKTEDAKFKLYLIQQREREQKLLYLLKMTGEEYLSTRENYEKQLRLYQTENMAELRAQLEAANRRIKELEQNATASYQIVSETVVAPETVAAEPAVQESVTESVAEPVVQSETTSVPAKVKPVSDEEMYSLKEKAKLIQRMLDEKNGGK